MIRTIAGINTVLCVSMFSIAGAEQPIRMQKDGEETSQPAYLRLRDGRIYYGRVIQRNDDVYVWQSPNGRVHRIPSNHVANFVSLPSGARPMRFRTPQGKDVFLPFGDLSWADAAVTYRRGKPGPRHKAGGSLAVGRPDHRKDGDRCSAVLGHGGMLVVQFVDNHLVDVAGPDLAIIEVGPQVEPTKVAISENGKKWINVGVAQGANSLLDIRQFVAVGQRFRYVMLVDAMAGLSNGTRTPGADIDAVGAMGTMPASDNEYPSTYDGYIPSAEAPTGRYSVEQHRTVQE